MSAAATLISIATGERPAGLLQTCRLLAGGVEHYGIEAVAAQFRMAPLDLTAAKLVSDGDSVASVSADTVLIADAYGSNIARIWRIGPGPAVACEAAIDVPFDADMAQARGRVFADSQDLPRLQTAEIDRLMASIGAELDSWTIEGAVASRARAFALRAVRGDGLLVGLFAVHALAAAERRTARFTHAALVIEEDTPRLVREVSAEAAAPAQAWTPRAT